MTKENTKAFLYLKDYANSGHDHFFLFNEGQLAKASPNEVVADTALLVCHDYWLIAPTLLQLTGTLPSHIVDIDEFQVMISGLKQERKLRDKKDISRRISCLPVDQSVCRNYFKIFNRSLPFNEAIYLEFGAALLSFWDTLKSTAQKKNELERFQVIEQPVSRYLISSAAKGIAIDVERLRAHKHTLEHDYYSALKKFSACYDLPLEVPNEQDIITYLEPRGFDFTGVDVDYVLKFVPMNDNFATDLINLRKLAHSRNVLAALPTSKARIFPLVDSFGSITSRIYFKDPSLQNLAKKHRDILVPDEGKQFCYVDYDQYEVGIMAALSGDPRLLELYSAGDIYTELATLLFSDPEKRKHAKRLFLAYAYGMNMNALITAATGYGAGRVAARSIFRSFSVFEAWKTSIWETFSSEDRVGTCLGNYLNRERNGTLQGQEQRSAVSQVVQGTASLIFKKALLALSVLSNVELKLPMHDAVLVQTPKDYDVNQLPSILGDVMSNHFKGLVNGKASIEPFFPV